MGERLRSYLDFAENDYKYFMSSYDREDVFNSMAAVAQNSCEKYLKYLIDTYYDPENREQDMEQLSVLRSHNLDKIMRFIEEDMQEDIDENVKNSLLRINNYYFSTRYPGEDSITITKEDLKNCKNALEMCRKEVLGIEEHIKNEIKNTQENAVDAQLDNIRNIQHTHYFTTSDINRDEIGN